MDQRNTTYEQPSARCFIAIDFETGDAGHDSACALALVRVEHDVVVQREARLIRPPRRMAARNIAIHGITERMVAKAQPFYQVWNELRSMLDGVPLLVAHNAGFDRGVLEACCRAQGITPPSVTWRCTLQLARERWPDWPGYKLNLCCQQLAIELQHHDALSDALACASLYLQAHGRQLIREPAKTTALSAHIVEVHAENGAMVFVCTRCAIPERFHGYAVETVTQAVMRRHAHCMENRTFPRSYETTPSEPGLVSPPPGETGALFGDVPRSVPSKRRS